MSEELRPCPFHTCDTFGTCGCYDILYMSDKDWNTRPIEDALNKRIAELSQAVGLITTLKPTMVMDADHPLDMAKEVEAYVTARIAELEAEIDQLTARWRQERQDDKSSNDTQTQTIVYGWVTVGVTNPLDSQGIVKRNGGEG